ncbi:MAG: glycosyltransferase family 2 protein [Candidatus Paralactobacillus gallistercoris]|uniref:Glycosyltransferase family 2 protein n=1 Tax=Candidatus Paralactobacillus gallistercoris TaxID=2838724 RepID=A0A948TIA4_9LACO|nr:glycosyltransferase family 2 protein [Candidatus Paralactobacillus gallistercoris]
MANTRLTIVVPCYNEEEVLPKSSVVLSDILHEMMDKGQIATDSQILFVDDGSKDRTWKIIRELEEKDHCFSGLRFSRNFGHQNALVAGMTTAYKYSDAVITIDSDLQDDPHLIPEMVAKYQEGYDVVFAVRNDRSTDSAFKRNTAELFYKIMGKLGVDMVPDHADYRLLSHRALGELLKFSEHDPFLRGLVPQVGFPATKLYYKRAPRAAGESKYPLKKMVKFALDGITSNSVTPLKALAVVGAGVTAIGGIIGIVDLIKLCLGFNETLLNGVMVSLWILGGINLMGLGVVGTYVGKVFTESKNRPRYIIQEDDYTPQFNQNNKN